MPKIARVYAVNYPRHVTQRGKNRETVFFDDDDINGIWEVSLYFHRGWAVSSSCYNLTTTTQFVDGLGINMFFEQAVIVEHACESNMTCGAAIGSILVKRHEEELTAHPPLFKKTKVKFLICFSVCFLRIDKTTS